MCGQRGQRDAGARSEGTTWGSHIPDPFTGEGRGKAGCVEARRGVKDAQAPMGPTNPHSPVHMLFPGHGHT